MSAETHAKIGRARLWLVLNEAAAAPRSLTQVTELCLQGGVEAVLFRMKEADEAAIVREGRKVRDVCRRYDVPMILSHFPHLAMDIDADGIQLGASDLPIEHVRSFCGELLLGFSAHSIDEARQVVVQGADYVFLGPVFPTPAKLAHGKPLGVRIVLEATEIGIPAVFVGGIGPGNLPQVIAAGGNRVAAIRALQAVDDPCGAATEMRRLLDESTMVA